MTKATTIKGDAHATETDEKARGTGHKDKGEITRHADGSHDEKTHGAHEYLLDYVCGMPHECCTQDMRRRF